MLCAVMLNVVMLNVRVPENECISYVCFTKNGFVMEQHLLYIFVQICATTVAAINPLIGIINL